MEKNKRFDWLISVKPNTFMSVGFAVIAATGVLGELFSWPAVWPGLARKLVGAAMCIGGWGLHLYCHKFHKLAHQKAGTIQNVITSGPFSLIRHPMYLGLIFMYFGFAIGWGIAWMLLPAALFSAIVILTAIREEAFLSQKLGAQYEDYKQRVRWRFIPKVF